MGNLCALIVFLWQVEEGESLPLLRCGVLVFVCLCTLGAAQATSRDETGRRRAALISVEHQWTKAEVHGDVAYVDELLLPEYQSVDANGRTHPKNAILASTKRNRSSNKMARLVADFEKKHPYGTLVNIRGDTAIVTFYSRKLGPLRGIMSSDIFLYVRGGWHALYSQHTQVGN